jgi:peptide/nickel transport system substrate-binding protein
MQAHTKPSKSLFASMRDLLWSYPSVLFFGRSSVTYLLVQYYQKTRPLSHFLSTVSIHFLLILLLVSNVQGVLRINTSHYIEGTIVGVDQNGELLGLKRINPLVPSNIQLESDISNLVYESLMRVNQNGEISNQLINKVLEIKPANHYQFELKRDVFWHDGKPFTVRDVEATFALLKDIDTNVEIANNFSSVVSRQLQDIKIIDDYTFELRLKEDDAVLPTFFESLTFKILPAHYIDEVDSSSILTSKPLINRLPIGTGPYMFDEATLSTITLRVNEAYHSQNPSIERITFRLFADPEDALLALKGGRIHALAGYYDESMDELESAYGFTVHKSNIIYNQYWALYFNLGRDSELYPFSSVEVRRAFAYAVNRAEIIEKLYYNAKEAYGPIPQNSYAFGTELEYPTYDPQHAIELLEEEGWYINPDTGFREKDGSMLSTRIVYVDNLDRNRIAEVVKKNFEDIGCRVVLEGTTVDTVRNVHILPKTKPFDILLFGQTTAIDPDRYELFHSSQINFAQAGGEEDSTGLNISSYISSELDVKIDPEIKDVVQKPMADSLLEDGRSFVDKKKRAEKYIQFQELLIEDTPAIFLYHPIYPYLVSNRVKGIDLKNMIHISDRFNSISQWSIEV